MRYAPDHPLWRDCNYTPGWVTRRHQAGQEVNDDALAVSSATLQGARGAITLLIHCHIYAVLPSNYRCASSQSFQEISR